MRHAHWFITPIALALLSCPLLLGVDSCGPEVNLGRLDEQDAGEKPSGPDGGPAPTDASAPSADPCGGCETGEYCQLTACGSTEGQCAPRPEVCTEEYAPVCGCDGETHSNACFAAAAGVTVASEGACEDVPSGDPCAGSCRDTEYCKLSTCNATEGVCAVLPGACDDQYDPVCGCDGKTYGNACYAASQGINVASSGECAAGGAVCNAEYAPVCGSDGKTYGNACEAQQAGVSVQSEGACPAGEVCGGIAGLTCSDPTTQFCDYEQGTGCISKDGTPIADASGICAPLGGPVCTTDYAPVCGCDGETYSNRCNAHAAGVAVAQEGGC